jgi:hypothetical protein
LAVAVIHFVLLGLFPEQNPAQQRWVTVIPDSDPSWLTRYIETQSYWLGFSYALMLAFSAVALRRYHENRMCAAKNLTIGGITLSGFLAAAGCYLLGCCGSPMLVIYLNIFGAAFLPLAKPLIAVVTTLTVFIAWRWMNHPKRSRVVSLTANSNNNSRNGWDDSKRKKKPNVNMTS